MLTNLLAYINTYGYKAIFLLIAIENLFPPIPCEIILTFGGFMTTITNLTPLGVITAVSYTHLNLYKPKDDDYIFMNHYTKARGRLKYAQSRANLNPEFTLHSFRHSHVSMLIELGYSALMIAERIGDTVETTLKRCV